MSSGICGAALVRAANAMLTALGGNQVSLLLPATATASDAAAQLGLVDPGVQEVIINPVVARNLPTGSLGPRRRIEWHSSIRPEATRLSQMNHRNVPTVDGVWLYTAAAYRRAPARTSGSDSGTS